MTSLLNQREKRQHKPTVKETEQQLHHLSEKLNQRSDNLLRPYTSNHTASRPNNQINDVLCREYQDKFHFILPAFMKVQYQAITNLMLDISVAEISTVLTVQVYYGDLPSEFVDQLAQSIQLRISNRCELYLKEDQFVQNLVSNMRTSRDMENRVLVFTIQAMLPTEIRCDVFWTPFETLYLRMTVKIAAQAMQFLDKEADVHFNILYPGERLEQLNTSFNDNTIPPLAKRCRDFFSVEHYVGSQQDHAQLGQVFDISHVERYNEYGVSSSSRRFEIFKSTQDTDKKNIKGVFDRFRKCFGCKKKGEGGQKNKKPKKVSKQEVEQSQEAEKITKVLEEEKITIQECFFIDALKPSSSSKIPSWNIAMFEFKLFRYPLTTVIEVLIPSVFLALINLAIYFQEVGLSNRISSIATLLVAYTTFLPTVRQRIPPSPRLTLIELLLYAIMLSSSLCLLRSFIDRNDNPDEYVFAWRNDACFIISLSLLIFVLVVVTIGLIVRQMQVVLDAREYTKYSESTGNVESASRERWACLAAQTIYQSKFLPLYKPYSRPFVRNQAIFERLWLWRYKNGLLSLGPEKEPQCDWQIPLTLNIEEMHYRKMERIVARFERYYWEFYKFVNEVLYIHELKNRLETMQRDNNPIFEFYSERKRELERNISQSKTRHHHRDLLVSVGELQRQNGPNIPVLSNNVLEEFRQARTMFVLQYIRLEEHVEEDIEFRFEEISRSELLRQTSIRSLSDPSPMNSTLRTGRPLLPFNGMQREIEQLNH